MPAYRFGVLGAGRQGTAAAYDLVARGEATSVILADLHAGRGAPPGARPPARRFWTRGIGEPSARCWSRSTRS